MFEEGYWEGEKSWYQFHPSYRVNPWKKRPQSLMASTIYVGLIVGRDVELYQEGEEICANDVIDFIGEQLADIQVGASATAQEGFWYHEDEVHKEPSLAIHVIPPKGFKYRTFKKKMTELAQAIGDEFGQQEVLITHMREGVWKSHDIYEHVEEEEAA